MSNAPLQKVTLNLGSEDLSHVRFAFSPLWECVAAFRAWIDPSRHALLLPWLARIGPAKSLHAWEPLTSLALVSRGAIPDFLAPPPLTPLPRLIDELDSLRRVSAKVLRTEIEIAYPKGMPRPMELVIRDPVGFASKIAELLQKFWQFALASEWSLFRSKLEAEVLFRSRALAFGGPEALFKGVHSDVHYERGKLTIRTVSHWDGLRRRRGILLVPSIFSWPDVFLTVRPPWRPTLTYTCRGVAELWSDIGQQSEPGAHRLLGATCAKVIARLRTPQTTIEIARALRLSAPAASEQITRLWRTGLLERTRIGRRVFYALSQKGNALLSALE